VLLCVFTTWTVCLCEFVSSSWMNWETAGTSEELPSSCRQVRKTDRWDRGRWKTDRWDRGRWKTDRWDRGRWRTDRWDRGRWRTDRNGEAVLHLERIYLWCVQGPAGQWFFRGIGEDVEQEVTLPGGGEVHRQPCVDWTRALIPQLQNNIINIISVIRRCGLCEKTSDILLLLTSSLGGTGKYGWIQVTS